MCIIIIINMYYYYAMANCFLFLFYVYNLSDRGRRISKKKEPVAIMTAGRMLLLLAMGKSEMQSITKNRA